MASPLVSQLISSIMIPQNLGSSTRPEQSLFFLTPKDSSVGLGPWFVSKYYRFEIALPCSMRPSSNCMCIYSCTNAKGAYTNGTLSTDTLTLSSFNSNRGTVAFPNVIFGCSFNIKGNFGPLSAGPLSLLKSVASVCTKEVRLLLGPKNVARQKQQDGFGDDAIISGEGTVNIHLISNPVTLKAIAVGNKIVWSNTETANALIDSSFTFTHVAASAYDHLETEVKSAINITSVKVNAKGLELCHDFPRGFKVPDIKFVFDGGEVVLGAKNTIRPVSDENKKTEVSCLHFGI